VCLTLRFTNLDPSFTAYDNFKLTNKLSPIVNVISQLTYAWI